MSIDSTASSSAPELFWRAYSGGMDDFEANASKVQTALEAAGYFALRDHLGNILARIHGDGGHYQLRHGTDKAVEHADMVVSALRAERDALRGEVERLKADRDALGDAVATWRDAYALANANNESALAAERERAEANARDARRWDWLQNEAHALDWTDDGERRVIVADVGDEFTGETWREAIDAALAAQEGNNGSR
jgi:hypothetical protein